MRKKSENHNKFICNLHILDQKGLYKQAATCKVLVFLCKFEQIILCFRKYNKKRRYK